MLIAAAALGLGGCGFHPVGSAQVLPKTMGAIYVASHEPYGNLENELRRAIVARGAQVADSRRQANTLLTILSADFDRRVLAVNTSGQPVEYQIVYWVRFGLADVGGTSRLPPQSLKLSRYLAYNTSIELGTSRRQMQLERDMQNEAVQLIMLRLEAVAEKGKTGSAAR